MRTCCRWTRPWLCWISLAVALLAGCRHGPPADGGIPAELATRLAAEPAACQAYRNHYVRAFHRHVAALSRHDEAAETGARQELERLRRELADQGLDADQCSRPRCIIEPLQGGKLDSWCGFRLPDRDGPNLYRWVAWPPPGGAARTEESP
ncbi:isopropylmalate isomerase [Alloalcanivorax gelatiniphagus]|uniref:Isopropylmalate isomerase n=1 Tax=Alloalcanivorax gelatiniphagus TaxID=1194167 RepID=A0ABY2XI20_9GAMM|nr:isopropylmalate isomerase [Alloalcanivorax gelatiniphagus]TMW10615.1 isopropylmalate isomerase [Alloalcanivorax gelatiniphagus]